LRVGWPDFVPMDCGLFVGPGAGTINSGCELMIQIATEVFIMLSWVVTFLVIALIAGILGFGGVAGASIEIAKIIFFIAVVLFIVSAVISIARGRTRA
jgi:uncharacterized membrane protein YtjA (UPF0391 family)